MKIFQLIIPFQPLRSNAKWNFPCLHDYTVLYYCFYCTATLLFLSSLKKTYNMYRETSLVYNTQKSVRLFLGGIMTNSGVYTTCNGESNLSYDLLPVQYTKLTLDLRIFLVYPWSLLQVLYRRVSGWCCNHGKRETDLRRLIPGVNSGSIVYSTPYTAPYTVY